jgi:hypothetical protein
VWLPSFCWPRALSPFWTNCCSCQWDSWLRVVHIFDGVFISPSHKTQRTVWIQLSKHCIFFYQIACCVDLISTFSFLVCLSAIFYSKDCVCVCVCVSVCLFSGSSKTLFQWFLQFLGRLGFSWGLCVGWFFLSWDFIYSDAQLWGNDCTISFWQ